jgi:hypothetical protein
VLHHGIYDDKCQGNNVHPEVFLEVILVLEKGNHQEEKWNDKPKSAGQEFERNQGKTAGHGSDEKPNQTNNYNH